MAAKVRLENPTKNIMLIGLMAVISQQSMNGRNSLFILLTGNSKGQVLQLNYCIVTFAQYSSSFGSFNH